MPLELALLRPVALTVASALLPITLASFSSITPPKEPGSKDKAEQDQDQVDDFDEELIEVEQITASDALWIPVISGAFLVTLFLAFKYLDKDLINMVFVNFFRVLGLLMFTRMGLALTKMWKGRAGWRQLTRYQLLLKTNGEESASFSCTRYHILFASLALAAVVAEKHTGHYMLLNLAATVACFNTISSVRFDSFKTASLLLAALFLYDIYFVFGTNIMVTVAKSFEAPCKMVWPTANTSSSSVKPQFTMLGLGDIILPGWFIAIALRFDHARSLRSSLSKRSTSSDHITPTANEDQPTKAGMASFSKPYFWSVLSAYTLGLLLTIGVMNYFLAPQPALLYLSPACIGSVALCAGLRGEWRELWAYTEGQPEEAEPKPPQQQEEKPLNGNGKERPLLSSAAMEKSEPSEGDVAENEDRRRGKATSIAPRPAGSPSEDTRRRHGKTSLEAS